MNTKLCLKDKVQQVATGLSKNQRLILCYLLANTRNLEEQHTQDALEELELGIPWNVGRADDSLCASISRSLLRLESRGLVNRIAPNRRTVRVKLTTLGRIVALKLEKARES
jgi:hypothetical protein